MPLKSLLQAIKKIPSGKLCVSMLQWSVIVCKIITSRKQIHLGVKNVAKEQKCGTGFLSLTQTRTVFGPCFNINIFSQDPRPGASCKNSSITAPEGTEVCPEKTVHTPHTNTLPSLSYWDDTLRVDRDRIQTHTRT